jgi:hypothetical protein
MASFFKLKPVAFAGFVLFATVSALSAQIISTDTNLTAREQQIIAVAKPGSAPQFNNARVVGIRPGTPFIYSLAVTGERPVTFSSKPLPSGLELDAHIGIVTGPKILQVLLRRKLRSCAVMLWR